MDPKASDPAMDAEGFVMVPSSNYRPDKKEEKDSQNPKDSSHRTEHYPEYGGSFKVKVPGFIKLHFHFIEQRAQADKYFNKQLYAVILGLIEPGELVVDQINLKVRTSPSFAEAAMGIIAQGTKVLAEGGYEKIFRQTFETVPEEQLENSFACYLSTSAGPVMGVLYVSTAKLAYCSDSRLAYKTGSHTEWNYYKVVIPLHQLKSVNPSTSRVNHSEKYIQVISLDSHEFWFMGFLYYDAAVKCLQDVLQLHSFHFV
ncbi:hypothetical protein GOBAR_DD33555 [Gossypium barbadense]|nr:hypothetical protein GOBAR_DD33555 [Gossypium barbadense]